jgi:hypothetical protein
MSLINQGYSLIKISLIFGISRQRIYAIKRDFNKDLQRVQDEKIC